jgi:CubicO group peptidase (beta-lactamase class C family)
MRSAASLALLLAVPAAAQAPAEPTPYQRAIAAGYKAAFVCSGIFTSGRTEKQIDADELTGIYPEYERIVPTLKAEVNRSYGHVQVHWAEDLPPRTAVYDVSNGCTLLPIGRTYAAPAIFHPSPPRSPRLGPWAARWPAGDVGVKPRPSRALADVVARAFDKTSFGARSRTTGVLILRDGEVVAERYAVGWGPFTANRTWSVAKSIAGTLVGFAATRNGSDVEKPAFIPEWQAGGGSDIRRAISLDQLLRMASGLHSDTAGNRTDAIYFGGTAVTDEATVWDVEARPGTRFRYANNDTLLAVRSLRASLGEDRYQALPHQLFGALGMSHTQAGQDWRGNYILSSQVWSTVRDLARLGQFWLQDGVWQGTRLLPAGWMKYMTTPSGPQPASGPRYGATLWLFGPAQGLPAGSYAAQGNRGQYVMVVPFERLVVVRRGEDPGTARFDIAKFTADVIRAK